MPYINEPIKKFTTDLSAKLPAPGGGSAAALVGAVASSLNCMVANFTVGNEKYATVEKEVQKSLLVSENLRDELLRLVEEDIRVYGEYSKSSKLSKNTEEEKKIRAKEIENKTKQAADVPYKIMLCCLKVLESCELLLLKGNKNLLSDVGVAAYFANAALKAAYLNVIVNLLYLKDEAFKSKIRTEMLKLLQKADTSERKIEAQCRKSLNG